MSRDQIEILENFFKLKSLLYEFCEQQKEKESKYTIFLKLKNFLCRFCEQQKEYKFCGQQKEKESKYTIKDVQNKKYLESITYDINFLIKQFQDILPESLIINIKFLIQTSYNSKEDCKKELENILSDIESHLRNILGIKIFSISDIYIFSIFGKIIHSIYALKEIVFIIFLGITYILLFRVLNYYNISFLITEISLRQAIITAIGSLLFILFLFIQIPIIIAYIFNINTLFNINTKTFTSTLALLILIFLSIFTKHYLFSIIILAILFILNIKTLFMLSSSLIALTFYLFCVLDIILILKLYNNNILAFIFIIPLFLIGMLIHYIFNHKIQAVSNFKIVINLLLAILVFSILFIPQDKIIKIYHLFFPIEKVKIIAKDKSINRYLDKEYYLLLSTNNYLVVKQQLNDSEVLILPKKDIKEIKILNPISVHLFPEMEKLLNQ